MSIFDGLIDISDLLARERTNELDEFKTFKLLQNQIFQRIVIIKKDQKSMACGTMMICRTGLKEGSGFNPVPFETVGIIGGIMIDPEFFGKPEGDSVLKVLV